MVTSVMINLLGHRFDLSSRVGTRSGTEGNYLATSILHQDQLLIGKHRQLGHMRGAPTLSAKDLATGALCGIQLHVAQAKIRLRIVQGQVVFNAATRHQVHRGQGKGEEGLRSPEIWTSGYLSCWRASTGEADRSTLEHVAVSAHNQQILISWNISWYGRRLRLGRDMRPRTQLSTRRGQSSLTCG